MIDKFKAHFKKLITFLSLADCEGNLSISNVAVITLITKIALTETLDWTVIAALMMALLNYSHKRAVIAKAEREDHKNEGLPEIEAEVMGLTAQMKDLEELKETLVKQAEETQKLVSSLNLAKAFSKPSQR